MMDTRTAYERLGGEEAVRALSNRFYDAMETRPEANTILAMHKDMERARERFYLFLSGWLGGPGLYVERHGHPRLRMRHMPFPIDTDAAVAWLDCMKDALAPVEDEQLVEQLMTSFARVAAHMRNKE